VAGRITDTPASADGAEGTAAGGRTEGGTIRRWKVPTVTTKLNIDWPELQFAFDSSFGEVSCYLDRETGTVVTVTEDIRAAADDEDEAAGFDSQLLEVVRAIDDGSERYLPIPGQDGREGYRDMEEFIATVRNRRLVELLEVAIAGRGAFRRFKDVLAGSPAERERWFAWSDGRQRERILDWLTAEGIAPANAPAVPVVPPPAEPEREAAADLLEELTLLCLYLGSWEEPAIGQTVHRAWKGFRFEILDALEARGLIAQTRRAKSLTLTEEGRRRAQELERRLASISD
jgi:hypothetical protein